MEKIICEKLYENQVWEITLNDPKGNVIDGIMLREIDSVLNEIGKEPHCKLIVFKGSGKHFSFGVSVPEHTPDKAPQMLSFFHGLFIKLAELSIPVCSLISGQCLGGGLEIAGFAHFVFADESARLGQPEVNLAVFAPPASVILPLKMGYTYAEDLLLTGRSVTAVEAQKMGLVTTLYPNQTTMEKEVMKWIETHILGKSAVALKFAVRAARKRFNEQLKTDLEAFERIYLGELIQTHDGLEGLNSFMENRKPKWKDI